MAEDRTPTGRIVIMSTMPMQVLHVLDSSQLAEARAIMEALASQHGVRRGAETVLTDVDYAHIEARAIAFSPEPADLVKSLEAISKPLPPDPFWKKINRHAKRPRKR